MLHSIGQHHLPYAHKKQIKLPSIGQHRINDMHKSRPTQVVHDRVSLEMCRLRLMRETHV